ncbi:COG3631 Ketosteroid isomerase-related protein [Acidimicrobiia bacterium]
MGNNWGLDETRVRNLAAVEGAFAGIAAGDAEAQLANYTDDFVLDFPFSDPPKVVNGKAEGLPYLSGAFKVFRFSLTIGEVHACLDPDRLIVEFTGEGSYLPTGAPYANTYIVVFNFRNGLISRQREYFNPLAAQRATGATPPTR